MRAATATMAGGFTNEPPRTTRALRPDSIRRYFGLRGLFRGGIVRLLPLERSRSASPVNAGEVAGSFHDSEKQQTKNIET
jgi:hypothetical protein